MTAPTTPTGKRLHAEHDAPADECVACATNAAIEREAAAAERERLRQFHKRDPHHDARYCRWCARLEDPSDD